jgi:hypothetical protein
MSRRIAASIREWTICAKYPAISAGAGRVFAPT